MNILWMGVFSKNSVLHSFNAIVWRMQSIKWKKNFHSMKKGKRVLTFINLNLSQTNFRTTCSTNSHMHLPSSPWFSGKMVCNPTSTKTTRARLMKVNMRDVEGSEATERSFSSTVLWTKDVLNLSTMQTFINPKKLFSQKKTPNTRQHDATESDAKRTQLQFLFFILEACTVLWSYAVCSHVCWTWHATLET